MPTSPGSLIFQFHTRHSHQVIPWATPRATSPIFHCATPPQLNNCSPTQPCLADTTVPTFTVRCFSPHSTTEAAMDEKGSGLLQHWNWTGTVLKGKGLMQPSCPDSAWLPAEPTGQRGVSPIHNAEPAHKTSCHCQILFPRNS